MVENNSPVRGGCQLFGKNDEPIDIRSVKRNNEKREGTDQPQNSDVIHG